MTQVEGNGLELANTLHAAAASEVVMEQLQQKVNQLMWMLQEETAKNAAEREKNAIEREINIVEREKTNARFEALSKEIASCKFTEGNRGEKRRSNSRDEHTTRTNSDDGGQRQASSNNDKETRTEKGKEVIHTHTDSDNRGSQSGPSHQPLQTQCVEAGSSSMAIPKLAKLDFPRFRGSEDRLGWLNRCEPFFTLQQSSEEEKSKRMLEEEQKLVQRLQVEMDYEAQKAKRKVEEIGQQLADAQKDIENATTRVHIAENAWIKAKRELQEELQLVQLTKLECSGTSQSAMIRVEEKELELANALNAAAIAERMLEEERKLVQGLKLEKDEEAQMAKRKVDEIGQQLAEAQRDIEYATTRADVAENEWMKAKRELQEERELMQLLKLECEATRQSAMRQLEEKEPELANALNAAAIAENECAKLKRMLEEERNLFQSLKLEKDDEAQLAKRKMEELGQQLGDAQNDVEYANTRADVAENEWIKAKRELQEKGELVELLKLECEEARQSAQKQVEEKGLELANALNSSAIAKSECAKLKRALEEVQKLAERLKLEKDDEAQMAKRKVEEISQQLADAQKDLEFATTRADVAENEWIKAKRELEAKRELIELLKLEFEETRQSVTRQIEGKERELADALAAAAAAAESRSAAAEACAICLAHEKDMAFGCGHMTCEDCGLMLSMCPICREQITSRLRLFPG